MSFDEENMDFEKECPVCHNTGTTRRIARGWDEKPHCRWLCKKCGCRYTIYYRPAIKDYANELKGEKKCNNEK